MTCKNIENRLELLPLKALWLYPTLTILDMVEAYPGELDGWRRSLKRRQDEEMSLKRLRRKEVTNE